MQHTAAILLSFAAVSLAAQQVAPAAPNPYLRLMGQAHTHLQNHVQDHLPDHVHSNAPATPPPPVLSPLDSHVLNGSIPVNDLHQAGFRVVPWTTNDPGTMRRLIDLDVDGIISDRPDLLQEVVAEARRSRALSPTQRVRLPSFDISAHRGGRGLRPENTLPSFESGLDNLVTSLETDTGVTSDRKSLLWHDQFFNPQSCRRADGQPYTLDNLVYIRDISMAEAQRTFICDKLRRQAFPDQHNDVALSPVSLAFARQGGLRHIYVPIHAAQLFQFVRFYSDFYRTGPGRTHPHAAERALAAEGVRFNLETKILPGSSPSELASLPAGLHANHTVDPQTFVDTLTGAILSERMQSRCEIQSFDFRTLLLVQEQHPEIPTFYLVEDPGVLTTSFVPAPLRQAP